MSLLKPREKRMVQFLNAEIPEPRVLIDFLGFEKHVVQIRDKRGTTIPPQWYDHGGYFIVDLPPEKVFGTGEEVTVPPVTMAPDYEFEIACIVTEDALLKTKEEAVEFFREKCLLTIMNDWSCRDIQLIDMQALGPANSKFIVGKSFGPKLVPVKNYKLDENGVFDMEMVLTFNGDERIRTNYNTIYHTHPQTKEKAAWSFPRLIAWLGRQNISMHAGYILGSGTVGSGCIAEFTAKRDPNTGAEIAPATYPWLKDGDVVRMEAQGIGILENKVSIKAAQMASAR